MQFELSMSELGYLLFKKKECPKCKGLLRKKLRYETREAIEFKNALGSTIRNYFIFYKCEECGYWFRTNPLETFEEDNNT